MLDTTLKKKYCPDCNREIDRPIKKGWVQCTKCLQLVIFDNWEPIKSVPKNLIL